MSEDIIIEVNHLKKSFGSLHAVKDVSLNIKKGEVFGFLGANGSGKTTTLRMLCGLLTPDGGSGQCMGYDLRKQSYDIKTHVGYMTQRFSYYGDLTVLENLKFMAQMYDMKNARPKIERVLKTLGLEDKENQLTGTLSGGWKQKLALAASLLHDPQLLLLDEPTAGVDPNSRGEFWDSIHELSEQGITTLVSTHYMDEAERCTRLAYMSFGNILVKGTAHTIINEMQLKTYQVEGSNVYKLAKEMRQQEGLQVILYGNTLHVSGKPSPEFEALIERYRQMPDSKWQAIDTTLEDVFVYLMQKEKTS